MLTRFDKMFAALIVSGFIPAFSYFTGITVDPGIQAGAVTALTTFFVWLVPNKVAA